MQIKVKQSQAKPTYFKAYRLWDNPKTRMLVPVKVEQLGNQAIHHS